MYQILQKFDIHWHDGGPSIAMMCHLRRVSDLLYNWKSCLLCYMKDVVLHCSIFFKWNKLVRVRVRVRNTQSGSNSAILAPCDLEIWRMTLKNNRAPLLSNIKLYVSFHHHMWIQTGVTVRKRKFGSWPLWPRPLTLTFCMDLTLVQCDNSWKFHDDTMMGT